MFLVIRNKFCIKPKSFPPEPLLHSQNFSGYQKHPCLALWEEKCCQDGTYAKPSVQDDLPQRVRTLPDHNSETLLQFGKGTYYP